MKKVFSFILVVLFIFPIMTFFACDNGNSNGNIKPPNLSDSVVSPYVTQYGGMLNWYKINGAVKYEIYKDGNYIDSTTSDIYQTADFDSDHEYSVVAVDKEDKKSAKSNAVVVYKRGNFKQEEIIYYNSSVNGSKIVVESGVRKLVFGIEEKDPSVEIIIKDRVADLIIELESVNLSGKTDKDCISTEDGKRGKDWNLIFEIEGDCSITGGAGWSADPEFSYAIDTEMNGRPGKDGKRAIVASKIVVEGNGTLALHGGKGGNGENGSATSSGASAVPGKGSNGGNGGDGVFCDAIVLNSINLTKVELKGGKGGNKGNPGANGSVLTGPACSLVWGTVYDIGKPGTAGISLVGMSIVFNGNLEK